MPRDDYDDRPTNPAHSARRDGEDAFDPVERRFLRVSPKNQVTIPVGFMRQLRIGRTLECILRADDLILLPVRPGRTNPCSDENLRRQSLVERRVAEADLILQEKAGWKGLPETMGEMPPWTSEYRFMPEAHEYLARLEKPEDIEAYRDGLMFLSALHAEHEPLKDALQGLFGSEVYYSCAPKDIPEADRKWLVYRWDRQYASILVIVLAGSLEEMYRQLERRADCAQGGPGV